MHEGQSFIKLERTHLFNHGKIIVINYHWELGLFANGGDITKCWNQENTDKEDIIEVKGNPICFIVLSVITKWSIWI